MFSFGLIGYGDFEHADQHLQIYAHLQMVIRASPLYLPSTHAPSIFCLSCLSFAYLFRTHREDEEMLFEHILRSESVLSDVLNQLP